MSMTSDVAARIADATYRQLDWWARAGHIKSENEGSGSGSHRTWSAHEIEIARRISILVKAGVKLEVAAHFARSDWPNGEIASGVKLEVIEDGQGR